jgi:hypothetical protein
MRAGYGYRNGPDQPFLYVCIIKNAVDFITHLCYHLVRPYLCETASDV